MNTLTRAAIATSIALAAPALAGDVNPPAGPIQPTGVTLAEIRDVLDSIEAQAIDAYDLLTSVDPGTPIESLPGDVDVDFVISQPGSYFLSADWFGDGANTPIEVRASDVTIDLRGFNIVVGDFVAPAPIGVDTIGGVDRVRVYNGTIINSGGGVRLNGESNVVEDIRVTTAAGNGISVGGNSSVARCAVWGAGNGISVGDGSTIKDSVVRFCGNDGFVLGGASSIENCTSESNGGTGFAAGEATVLAGCVATRNGGAGFDLISSVVRECVAYKNASSGFSAINSTITACHSTDNIQVGFHLLAGNHVTRCSAVRNDVGGYSIIGVRNNVSFNHAANHTGGAFSYHLAASATDTFLYSNFAEQSSDYYDIDTADAAVGTQRINFTGATVWDNFSN